MTGPAFERFRLLNRTEEGSLQYCSNCKNCDISCPSGVPVSTFNMLARAEYCKTHKPPLRDWFVSHGEKLARGTSFIPSFLRNFGMNNPVTRFILDIAGIHRKAPLPPFASETFIQRFRKIVRKERVEKKVVFFPGCFVNIYRPQIGTDLVELLRMAGYEVIVPETFICCGLPLISNGFAHEAEKHAVQNSLELMKWAAQGVYVLVVCPSCALMLKREYKELFPDTACGGADPSYVVDACEFLSEIIEKGELIPGYKESGIDVIYHAPCHLRAQGMGKTGLELARRISGVTVTDADAGCCGISGSYGFKKDKYYIGMSIGLELFDTINRSGAGVVITECGTCQTQIHHGTGLSVIHPVSFLRYYC